MPYSAGNYIIGNFRVNHVGKLCLDVEKKGEEMGTYIINGEDDDIQLELHINQDFLLLSSRELRELGKILLDLADIKS